MILNWDKGRMTFGNSDELYKNELYTFSNIIVPPLVEKAVNSGVMKNIKDLKDTLARLKGSAKYFN